MRLSVLTFTSDLRGDSFDFLQLLCRVQKFAPSYSGRIAERPRMQEHGSHPVVPLRGPLRIQHEGLLVGLNADDLMVVRDNLNLVLLGFLNARPSSRRDGILTIQYPSWLESASGEVAIEEHEIALEKEHVRTAPYMIRWFAFAPYFTGDDSGDPYYL